MNRVYHIIHFKSILKKGSTLRGSYYEESDNSKNAKNSANSYIALIGLLLAYYYIILL